MTTSGSTTTTHSTADRQQAAAPVRATARACAPPNGPQVLRPDFLNKLDAVAASARALVIAAAANAPRGGGSQREGGGDEGGREGAGGGDEGESGRTREMELWVTELGGAYNSGRPGVTDSFLSSFWYLDALGVLTRHATKVNPDPAESGPAHPPEPRRPPPWQPVSLRCRRLAT